MYAPSLLMQSAKLSFLQLFFKKISGMEESGTNALKFTKENKSEMACWCEDWSMKLLGSLVCLSNTSEQQVPFHSLLLHTHTSPA